MAASPPQLNALLVSQLQLAADEESTGSDAAIDTCLGRHTLLSSLLQALTSLCENQLFAATSSDSNGGDSERISNRASGGGSLLAQVIESVRTAVLHALGLLDGTALSRCRSRGRRYV